MHSTVPNVFKNGFIALVFLLSPSFLTDVLLLKLGISLTIGRLGIFAILSLLATLSLLNSRFIQVQKKITLLYIVSIIYLCCIWVVLFNGNLMGAGPRMIIKNLVMGLFLMVLLNDSRFNIVSLSHFLVYLASILSALSLIQYFGYMYGFVPVTAGIIPGYEWQHLMGIGGFISLTPQNYLSGIPYRNLGFFSEPTNFAQFLQVPLFLSIQRYLNNKKLLNMAFVVTIAFALLLTFSVANFFGFLIIVAIYLGLRHKNIRKGAILPTTQLVGFVLVCYSFYLLYEVSNQNTYKSGMVIGKSTGATVLNRFDRMGIVFTAIQKNPLGNIEFGRQYAENAGFLGDVAIVGGYPLLFIMALLFIRYYSQVYKTLRRSKHRLVYVGCFTYLMPFLWDGQFYEVYFLFTIALFTTFIKHEAAGREII